MAISGIVAGCATTQAPQDEQPPESHVKSTGPAAELDADLLYELLVANLGYVAGETELATEAFTRAALDARDPVLVESAARTALHFKAYPSAAKLAALWVELAPQQDTAYFISGLAEALADHQAPSYAAFSRLLDQAETSVEPNALTAFYQQIGHLFQQHSPNTSALDVTEKLAQRHPELTEAWLVFASLAQKAKDETRLEAALDHILERDPSHQTAAIYKLVLAESQSLEALNTFAQTFLRGQPDAHEFHMQYAHALLRLDREGEALQQFESIITAKPDHAGALSVVGLLYHNQGQHEKAADYLQRRVQLAPDDDRYRYYLGTALRALDRNEEAIEALEAITADEFRFDAQRQLAYADEATQGTDAALETLESIQAEDSDQELALIVDQFNLLRRAQRWPDANKMINHGLDQFPDHTELLYQRALLAVDRKDVAAHERDMRRLIELKPDDANYYNTLGYTLADFSMRLDEARELVEKAAELSPNDAYITDSLGWIEFRDGNHAKAIELLLKAYELKPDAEIAAHLGEVYWIEQQFDHAKAIWQKGKTLDNDNKTLNKTMQHYLTE